MMNMTLQQENERLALDNVRLRAALAETLRNVSALYFDEVVPRTLNPRSPIPAPVDNDAAAVSNGTISLVSVPDFPSLQPRIDAVRKAWIAKDAELEALRIQRDAASDPLEKRRLNISIKTKNRKRQKLIQTMKNLQFSSATSFCI